MRIQLQDLRFSLEMAKRTDGSLDITIYPLLTAWGFTTDSNIDFLLLTENSEIYLTNGLKDKFTLSEAYKNMVVNVIER